MTRTSGEIHLDDITIDTIEQSLNCFLAHQFAWKHKAQRVNTLIQDIERLGISCLRIINFNVLTNIPHIRVLLVTSYERELSGESIGCLQIRQVFTAIEGLHIKTFICSPYQALLEVGTLEVDLNLVQPLLCGWRSELGKELFFVCHRIRYYYISFVLSYTFQATKIQTFCSK